MEQLKQLLTAAGIAYKENEPLAVHCIFKIGGPARLFVQPADRAQLCRAVALCKAQGVRHYLLGNGSNILFADEGYNGAVLDISSMQDAVQVHGVPVLHPGLVAQRGAVFRKLACSRRSSRCAIRPIGRPTAIPQTLAKPRGQMPRH